MLGVAGLDGNVGKIRFSDLSATLDWTGALHLKAHAGKSTVVLGELERWGAHVALRIHGEMTKIEGTVAVDSAEFDGFLGHPKGWRYRIEGGANLRIARGGDSQWRDVNLRGRLNHREGMLEVAGLDGNVGKIRFSDLSATLDWTGEPRLKAHAGKSTVVLGAQRWGGHVALRIHGEMTKIEGIVAVDSAEFDGFLGHPKGWRYRIEGGRTSGLPGAAIRNGGMSDLRGRLNHREGIPR